MEDVGVENKEWYDGPEDFPNGPVIDEITHRFISEDAQRAAALQENEVDVAHGLTASAQTNFQDSADYQTKAVETGGYLFMQYPVQVAPFDQQNVRRAVNHLIPRQRMTDNIEEGWSRPAWTPLPELAYGAGTTDPEQLEEDLRPLNEFDPQRANELISNADVETPIEVQIETNSDNQNRVQKVQAIAQAMNQTDLFDATVETFEFGDFVGRLLDPSYAERGNIAVIGLSGTFNPGASSTPPTTSRTSHSAVTSRWSTSSRSTRASMRPGSTSTSSATSRSGPRGTTSSGGRSSRPAPTPTWTST